MALNTDGAKDAPASKDKTKAKKTTARTPKKTTRTTTKAVKETAAQTEVAAPASRKKTTEADRPVKVPRARRTRRNPKAAVTEPVVADVSTTAAPIVESEPVVVWPMNENDEMEDARAMVAHMTNIIVDAPMDRTSRFDFDREAPNDRTDHDFEFPIRGEPDDNGQDVALEDAPAEFVDDEPTDEPAAPSTTDRRPPDRDDRRDRRGPRRRGRRGRGRDAAKKEPTPVEEPVDEDESDVPTLTEISRFVTTSAPGRGGQSIREMVINVSGTDECRIAVLQDNRLEELFIERRSTESHVGNIYKGRVVNVEPSIQAAFIDFGLPKHGFLHISDVQPQYFPDSKGQPEEVGRKTPRHHRPPIQRCFRRGQEVMVQIIKEGVGTKGPTLTTYLSIPGRFLVMMPGMSRSGVSRKIEDEDARRQMRVIMDELKLPQSMGFILRTAGMGRTKRELQRDLNYLMRLWKTVVDRVKTNPSPAELYRESDLVTRTIRDVYSADFTRLVIDDAKTAQKALEFLQIAMPRAKTVVELYLEREPIFHRFGIEDEIDRINQRHVPLKSGGSLVIDSTEALVAIDVNSGKFRSPEDAEETAYKLNLEAAEEIARQLRLRDLGGLIICDFIDMRQDRHKRNVERALRDALKKHKERARILRMSAFGLIEMTRQRQGPSIKRNIYFDCPHCKGAGQVKMPESVILDVMRLIQLATHQQQVQKVTAAVASTVAFQLLNTKRAALAEIETQTGKTIIVRSDPGFTSDQVEITCTDARAQIVTIPGLKASDLSFERRPRGWGKNREVVESADTNGEFEV